MPGVRSNKKDSRFAVTGLHPTRAAFTLVELLVVIAIVALLLAILIPSLSSARGTARQVREASAAQQLMAAYSMYASDNRNSVLPGYLPSSMVAGPIVVQDEAGERLTGETAQRYPWRLAPYLEYNFKGLYKDDRLFADLNAARDLYAQFGVDYRYVISLFPSLALNVAFVGGSDRHLAFNPQAIRQFGKFYVTRIDEPRSPDRLLVFVSGRCEQQAYIPELGRPEGFFRADPPWFATRNWAAAYDPDAPLPGLNSGFVSLRYGARGSRRAVAAAMDGHCWSPGWDALQDMRIWADRATRPDWTIGAGGGP
jgi:prepilin-type N-terminal cleavage/methylation domain-containing protein